MDAGCRTTFDIDNTLDKGPGSNTEDRIEDRRGKSTSKWIKLFGPDTITITSQQCGGAPMAKRYVNTWATAYGFQDQFCFGDGDNGDYARCLSDGELYAGNNYFFCKVWGDKVGVGFSFNHFWLLTDLDRTYNPNTNPARNPARDGRSFVSAYYLTGGPNSTNNDSAYYYDSSSRTWKWIPDC